MAELNLRQLEYFVAAAESGSVTAAASHLHLSQSAVSTALADLERALGAQLFLRHPRGVALTRTGESILARSRRLLSGVEDLHDTARSAQESLVGRLTVGCYTTLSPIVLPAIIDRFTRAHPAVDLDLVEGSHDELEVLLRSGVLDLALLYHYGFRDRERDDLERSTVTNSPPYVLVPAGHALAERAEVELRLLAEEPLILFDLPPGGEYFLSLFQDAGLEPKIRLRTKSFELVRSLVGRGLGYSVLSQHPRTGVTYEGHEVRDVPLAGSFGGLDVDAVTLRGLQATQRTQAFVESCMASHSS